jgi:hypothetical protein
MSNKTNFILDITILIAFIVDYNVHLTGNAIHEWLGVAFAAAIILHLLFHWKWIVNITLQYFKKFFHRSRLDYMVDLLFFIAMTGAIFSGLMISKDVLAALGINLGEVNFAWKSIHKLTADASLILLGLHFALHWKWVVATVGRYVVTPVANLFRRDTPKPASSTNAD